MKFNDQVIPRDFHGCNLLDFQRTLKCSDRPRVLNLNTFSGSLTPDWLQPEALTKFTESFAPLRAFLSVFDPAAYAPKASNVIKYVEAGSATLVNPTDFQQGGSVVGAIEVSVDHLSQPWPMSNADAHNGGRSRDLFLANAQALADTITKKWTALLTAANYPNTPVTGATFSLSDAAAAYGQIKGPAKSLILDTPFFGQLSHSSPKAFQSGEPAHGWQGVYDSSSGWSAAEAKVRGVALARPAIVLVCGFLEQVYANNIVRRMIALPGLDLAVDWFTWYHQGTRTIWNSLDVVIGAAKGDEAGAVLIKTP